MSGYAPPTHQNDEIEADDDDLVAISGEQLDKGKGRASLAPPSQAASRAASPGGPAGLSGKIGSNASGSSVGQRALRHEIGGIRVETRYTGVDSLDESVGDSLVRFILLIRYAYISLNDPMAAPRLARDIQQDAPGPPTEFRQCCTSRMGSLGPAALHNYSCYPSISGRSSFPVPIRLYGNLCNRLYRQCGRHAQLQAVGRQSVRAIDCNVEMC